MKKYQREAIRLAGEILAQPEFSDLKRPRMVRCNAGCFIPPNHICYGEHTDPRCRGCRRLASNG